MTLDPGPTYLYRARDDNGRLLYIGIATDWTGRWRHHRERSPWFPSVSKLELELYPTRQAARDAEEAAIKREAPVHNVEHTDRDVRRQRGSRTEHRLKSFDHTARAGHEYQQLADAIDKAIKAWGPKTWDSDDEDGIAQVDLEALLIDLSRTVRYADYCDECRDRGRYPTPTDGTLPYPVAVQVNGAQLRALYQCGECGYRWPCTWAVDLHRYMPA